MRSRTRDNEASHVSGFRNGPLPPPALAVLAELPRLENNPHVIVGGNPGASLVNLEKPWGAIRGAATVRLWLSMGNDVVISMVNRLTNGLERFPSPEECRAAAEVDGIALPAGSLEDVRLHDLRHAFVSRWSIGRHGTADHREAAGAHPGANDDALCSSGVRSGQGGGSGYRRED